MAPARSALAMQRERHRTDIWIRYASIISTRQAKYDRAQFWFLYLFRRL
jgi:hypothetical protein